MNSKSLLGMGLALALGACASTPNNDAMLDNARAAVQSAEADPNVNKYDELDMAEARKQLNFAEGAATKHDVKEMDQAAYMAAQTARLAQARAAAKADDARVATGQAERDRIQLEARTREVEARTREANNAKAVAEAALGQRDQAQEQAARLQQELEQLKATPTPRGLLMTLSDVLFDTGKAELKPGAGSRIDQLAQFLQSHPDRRVQVDGFTDSVGSPEFNQQLSEERAEAVKAALLARGVDPSRVGTQGYGSAYPVASNTNSGGRQLNRRVEVVIGSEDNRPIAPRG
jgi:outer membrane protein OmpA-like peptidoglycan-associated protein